MSNYIFPPEAAQVGLAWGNRKRARFSNLVSRTETSQENRIGLTSVPDWEWDFEYRKLLETDEHAPDDQLRSVLGFFLGRHADFENFLIRDTEDFAVTEQLLGIGNDAQTKFFLIRTYGEFTWIVDAIKHPVDIPGVANSLTVYFDGSPVSASAYTYAGAGVLDFDAPVGEGVVVSAAFQYYHRVRFANSDQEVEQFMIQLWRAQTVNLVSVKETT